MCFSDFIFLHGIFFIYLLESLQRCVYFYSVHLKSENDSFKCMCQNVRYGLYILYWLQNVRRESRELELYLTCVSDKSQEGAEVLSKGGKKNQFLFNEFG